MNAARPVRVDAPDAGETDLLIARLLTVGTYVAVGLLGIGTALLLATGHSPLDTAPPLHLERLPFGDLPKPEGFLWLGLVVVLATPAARVAAALVAYVRTGERTMAIVAGLILLVISLSVALAVGAEG